MIAKVCAVLIHSDAALWFMHPLAGAQLVKGTIEGGETPQAAAIRELTEEAGVIAAWWDTRPIQTHASFAPGQSWAFVGLSAAPRPAAWVHHCADDGGHDFAFFWRPLAQPAPTGAHPVFRRAWDVITANWGPA